MRSSLALIHLVVDRLPGPSISAFFLMQRELYNDHIVFQSVIGVIGVVLVAQIRAYVELVTLIHGPTRIRLHPIDPSASCSRNMRNASPANLFLVSTTTKGE
jgi:hypothetical protein